MDINLTTTTNKIDLSLLDNDEFEFYQNYNEAIYYYIDGDFYFNYDDIYQPDLFYHNF